MRVYAQLTQGQRYQIEALLKTGHSQTMIAKVLIVHKSTISREIRRDRGLCGYRPKQARERAVMRRLIKSVPSHRFFYLDPGRLPDQTRLEPGTNLRPFV